MALLPIESFAIAILDTLIDCESHGIWISLPLICVHEYHSLFSSCLRSSS